MFAVLDQGLVVKGDDVKYLCVRPDPIGRSVLIRLDGEDVLVQVRTGLDSDTADKTFEACVETLEEAEVKLLVLGEVAVKAEAVHGLWLKAEVVPVSRKQSWAVVAKLESEDRLLNVQTYEKQADALKAIKSFAKILNEEEENSLVQVGEEMWTRPAETKCLTIKLVGDKAELYGRVTDAFPTLIAVFPNMAAAKKAADKAMAAINEAIDGEGEEKLLCLGQLWAKPKDIKFMKLDRKGGDFHIMVKLDSIDALQLASVLLQSKAGTELTRLVKAVNDAAAGDEDEDEDEEDEDEEEEEDEEEDEDEEEEEEDEEEEEEDEKPATAPPAASSDDFEWGDEPAAAPAPAKAAAEADDFDWGDEPAAPAPAPAAAAAEDDFDWGDEPAAPAPAPAAAAADDDFDWGDEPAAPAAAPAAAAAEDDFDWGDEPAAPAPAPAAAAAEDDFDWGDEPVSPAQAAAAAAEADDFDWGDEPAETPAPAAAASDDFDWGDEAEAAVAPSEAAITEEPGAAVEAAPAPPAPPAEDFDWGD